MNATIIKEEKGVSLIELLVVLTIVGILAMIGIPEYGRFAAKSKVRLSTNELLQNMRLARTMAIKENKAYLITFDYAANNYRIGFDGDGNGSLVDAADGYGPEQPPAGSGIFPPVRTIEMLSGYGQNIVLGSGSFTTMPPNGPNLSAGSKPADLYAISPTRS